MDFVCDPGRQSDYLVRVKFSSEVENIKLHFQMNYSGTDNEFHLHSLRLKLKPQKVAEKNHKNRKES